MQFHIKVNTKDESSETYDPMSSGIMIKYYEIDIGDTQSSEEEEFIRQLGYTRFKVLKWRQERMGIAGTDENIGINRGYLVRIFDDDGGDRYRDVFFPWIRHDFTGYDERGNISSHTCPYFPEHKVAATYVAPSGYVFDQPAIIMLEKNLKLTEMN